MKTKIKSYKAITIFLYIYMCALFFLFTLVFMQHVHAQEEGREVISIN